MGSTISHNTTAPKGLPCRIPIDPSRWTELGSAIQASADDKQIQAYAEHGVEQMQYAIDREGQLSATGSSVDADTRMYTTGPCLQGIPRGMREAITAPGKIILSADWRSSHPRLLAHISRDERMIEDLREGLYERLAVELGLSETLEIDRKLRKSVKVALNAWINGAGDKRIAEVLGETTTPLRKLIEGRYPQAVALTEALKGPKKAKKPPTAATPDGTRTEPKERYHAVGCYLRAIEADAIRRVLDEDWRAECKAHVQITGPDPKIILTVHDAIVCEGDPEHAETQAALLTAWMHQALMWRMPRTRMVELSDGRRIQEPAEMPMPEETTETTWGSHWGSDDGKAGRERPATPAAWMHLGSTTLVRMADDPTMTTDPEELYGLRLLAVRDAETYALRVAEIDGSRSDQRQTAKILRALANKAVKAANRQNRKTMRRKMKDEDSTMGLKDGTQVDIARDMLRHLGVGGVVTTDEDGTRIYDEETGVWRPKWRPNLKHEIESRYHDVVVETPDGEVKVLNMTETTTKAVCDKIDAATYRHRYFADIGYGFAAGKVMIDRDGNVREHSPDHRILEEHALPYEWDENAECPNFLRAIDNIWRGDADKDLKIQAFQEFIGLCMVGRATDGQRHLFLLGEKANNGKSTITKILAKLLPDSMTSTVDPQDWADAGGRAPLQYSRLNIVYEVPTSTKIKGANYIRSGLTGDSLTINPKYLKRVRVKIIAGNVWLGNGYFTFDDDSRGNTRRWIILEFNNVFVENLDEEIEGAHVPRGRRILIEPGMSRKIEQELPGIAAWAIRGLRRWIARGEKYQLPPSSVSAEKRWRQETDPTADFFGSRLIRDESYPSSSTDVWQAYQGYCMEMGLKPGPRKALTVRLQREYGDPIKRSSMYYPVRIVSSVAPPSLSGLQTGSVGYQHVTPEA